MTFMKGIIILIVFFISYLPRGVYASGIEDQHLELSSYTFFELWNPLLFISILLILRIYLFKIRKSKEIFVNGLGKVTFFCGLMIIFLALGSPLHILGDKYQFSAHMLEQSLIYIVMPPLVLLGLSEQMVTPIINFVKKYKIFIILRKPLISLLLFNILFSFYHIPVIFDVLVSNTILNNITHIILTITAFFMWLPVVPPTKSLESLSALKKIAYLFGAGVLLTPACALIIFADSPMYTTYANAPQLFEALPPLDDQQLGGVIMKVIQEIMFGSIIGYVFFKWAKIESLKDYVPDKVFYK